MDDHALSAAACGAQRTDEPTGSDGDGDIFSAAMWESRDRPGGGLRGFPILRPVKRS